MNSVLIVEDHRDTRALLRDLVTTVFGNPEVAEAATLSQALKIVAGRRFSLAVIDLGLPDGSGLELIEEIGRNEPDTFIVVATIHGDDGHLFPALRAGAKGYLLKEDHRDELEKQFQGILKGHPPLSPSIARRILEHFRRESRRKNAEDLTKRETEVLKLLARGYTSKALGTELGISRHTANEHIKNIYRKFNIRTRAEAAVQATRLGIVEQPETEYVTGPPDKHWDRGASTSGASESSPK